AFSPSTIEDEASQWGDWAFAFRNFLSLMDWGYFTDLKMAEQRTAPIDSSDFNGDFFEGRDDRKVRGMKLYSVLSSYLRNRPLKVLRSVDDMNGFEVWRRLTAELEPSSRSRSLAVAQALFGFPSMSKGASLMDYVLTNEKLVNEYDERLSGVRYDDNLKLGITSMDSREETKTQEMSEELEMREEVEDDDDFIDLSVLFAGYAEDATVRMVKMRRRTDPAWQKVARAKKISAGAVDSAAALDTVSWLFKHSGALCQRSTWSMRAKKLADSKLGLTRATIEKAELQRWREQLVEILLESKTPLAQQARLASNPLATIAASSSSMRASTLRKRIREWRKLRAFSMGLDGSPWPRHVGVVLDYLQERIAEPHRSGRSVGPGAVLEALAFTEKKGGYGSGDRLADLQIVKNCVNQATHDLEEQLVATVCGSDTWDLRNAGLDA
ncbi:YPTV4, partial [Symbiodinium microadriaticum]